MRVVGVDPGLTRCGVGVVEGTPGRQLHLVHVEVIRTSPELELGRRLMVIADRLAELFTEFEPDTVAVERVFAQHNLLTVTGTAQVAGLAVLAAARRDVPVGWHTPSEVKAAITGSGAANKQQVTEMITRILRQDTPPKPADAADALGLAVCHIWRGSAISRLDAELRQRRSAAGPAPKTWQAVVAKRGSAARPPVAERPAIPRRPLT